MSRLTILVKLTVLARYVGKHRAVGVVVGKGTGMTWPCRLRCGATVLNGYLDNLGTSPTTCCECLLYLGKRGFA